MIKSFKGKELEYLWINGQSKKIPYILVRRVLMKLELLDVATCIEDLRSPPSNNLHKLQGKYTDHWSVAVNGPWRLVFKIINNDIFDIILIQYH